MIFHRQDNPVIYTKKVAMSVSSLWIRKELWYQISKKNIFSELSFSIVLTNLDELLFLMVLALPYASKTGLHWIIWSSRVEVGCSCWKVGGRQAHKVGEHTGRGRGVQRFSCCRGYQRIFLCKVFFSIIWC